MDIGASSNITPKFSNLTHPFEYQGVDQVIVGNGTNLAIAHSSKRLLVALKYNLFLHNLLLVPKVSYNLLSLLSLMTINDETFFISMNTRFRTTKQGRFYFRACV